MTPNFRGTPSAPAALVLSCAWTLCGSVLSACGGSTEASGAPPVAARTDAPASREAPAPVAEPSPTSKSHPQSAVQTKPPPEKPAAPKALRITLAQLADRRDLWPAKVRLTQKVGFSPTEVYAPGTEMDLAEIAGRNLHLDTGNGLIEVPADRTDVLERASDLMGALTPDQLALTAQLLPRRPELWPVELKLVRPLGFGNGRSLPIGKTALGVPACKRVCGSAALDPGGT